MTSIYAWQGRRLSFALDTDLQRIAGYDSSAGRERAVRATIRDVAKAAGVSPSTVSRALSTPELVNDETRERVRKVAARLGYAPNRAARGLITGRTDNVGLIVPDLLNPFFPSLVKAIQARGRETDHAIFIADTDEDPAAEVRLVRALSKQVDGIVLCAPRASQEELAELGADTALVLVFRGSEDIPTVTVDNRDGMRQVVAHLSALGHTRIAWVGGPRASWSHGERTAGLRAAAAAYGVELIEVGHFPPYFEGGVAAGDQIVVAGATAAVAYNDTMALGLLSRLHARGVRVPADVSVVGIDDILMAGMASPALTTVQAPTRQAGRVAMDLLLALLEDPDRPVDRRRHLPVHLLVRDSTGPAQSNLSDNRRRTPPS